ncbi:THMS2 protein, partial [Pygoscelis papua]
MEPLSLQEYICSLDPATLPRILRICSGVYFQGECWVPAASKGYRKAVPPLPAMPLQPGLPPPALKMAGPLPQGCPCPGRGTGPRTATRHWCLRHSLLQKSFSSTPSAHPAECPSAFSHSARKAQGQSSSAPTVRRDVVKIPSTLEVDVEDVTEAAQHIHFARPLLLSEVLGMEAALPAQAEILEGPSGPAVFESAWVPRLRRGQRLQLHGHSHAWRVLASAPSSRRHFLLSSTYQGRFRQRPRQFKGVQELVAGLRPGRPLCVVVTQDCEGQGEDVPPLCMGDRLEARGLQGNGPGTRLLCHRHGEEEEEGEGKELLLPLDLGGSFVEEACDSKKYGLVELLERQPLPCEVRVVAPDPGLERDALGALPALRLEARLDQPFLVGSFCEEPEEGFEIPPRWLDLSLQLSEGPVHPPAPCTRRSRVEELTEAFYYRLLAQLPGSPAPPPPRPPKPAQAGSGPGARQPSAHRPPVPGPLPMSACPAPPLLPLPALPQPSTPSQYGRRGPPRDEGEAPSTSWAPAPPRGPSPETHCPDGRTGPPSSSNSTEHDYETVDDNVQKTIRKMQAIFPF